MRTVFAENKVDGEAFLELTEQDVKEMIKPLGQVKKIMRLQKLWALPEQASHESLVCLVLSYQYIFSLE